MTRILWTVLTLVMWFQFSPGAAAQSAAGSAPAAASGPVVKLSMPGNQFGVCNYQLATGSWNWKYAMVPGQEQLVEANRTWKITFDRGIVGQQKTYSLRPGHYRFLQTPQGWELYRSASMDTVDAKPIPLAPTPLIDN